MADEKKTEQVEEVVEAVKAKAAEKKTAAKKTEKKSAKAVDTEGMPNLRRST